MLISLRRVLLLGLLGFLGLVTPAAQAALITNGFTYAVADSCNGTGSHFHSNTGGSYGNPAGKAEVGNYSCEQVRGLSEYNISGLSSASSAFVTFNVFRAGGLFAGTNDTPFNGTITIEAYLGNNAENTGDFNAASTGLVGSFSTVGLLVGDTLSFDILSLFNAAILDSDTSLGIRLRADPSPTSSQAWTFDTFRLTTDDQSTGRVPEPTSVMLMLLALSAAAWVRRRSLSR